MSLIGIIASSRLTISAPPVSGYYAWWDASDTTTISLSGSNVTQWDDKSGNGYNLTQSNDSLRPSSGTRTINGLNVLDYSGYSDTLYSANASSVWKFLHYNTYTIFCVNLIDSFQSGYNGWWMATRGGNYAAGPGILAMYKDSTNKLEHAVVGNNDANLSNISTSTMSTATTTCWTIVGDPQNATAANRSDIRKNTGSAEKNNTISNAAYNVNPAQTLRIGDYTDGGGSSIDGAMAEILIYDSILTAQQITDTQNYLIDKWGI